MNCVIKRFYPNKYDTDSCRSDSCCRFCARTSNCFDAYARAFGLAFEITFDFEIPQGKQPQLTPNPIELAHLLCHISDFIRLPGSGHHANASTEWWLLRSCTYKLKHTPFKWLWLFEAIVQMLIFPFEHVGLILVFFLFEVEIKRKEWKYQVNVLQIIHLLRCKCYCNR